MNSYVILIVILVVFLLILKSKTKVKKTKKTKVKKERSVEAWLNEGKKIYKGKSHLMTATEQKFYHYIKKQFGEDKRVFAQVRVVDLIQVNWSELPKNSFDAKIAFRQLSQWHVDYVITDHYFKIICAAELDDKSHEKPERQKRDKILNQAFESAGIKLYRYSLKENDPRLLESI